MTDDEIDNVERYVNRKIREDHHLDERRSVSIREAEEMGAMMLFGEKYGDRVRVITFDPDFSRELCGGTHVKSTANIGYFKIISESAVAAGVRRIEAVTWYGFEQYMNGMEATMKGLKGLFKSADVLKSAEQLVAEKAELQKKLEKLEKEKTGVIRNVLRSKVAAGTVNKIIELVEVSSAEQLKDLSFQLKQDTENLFCVLGCIINDKPMLSVIISDNLVKDKNLHAGNIVKELAKEIQGGGGGQPFYATAGGNKAEGLQAALEKAKGLV
jgi:alanyl-tRNA synthetase